MIRRAEEKPSALRRSSAAEQAMDTIQQMILSGELSAGDALPAERHLAQMLQISRPTLRQAIGGLTAMNILESRQGEGTFVTALTAEQLTEPLRFLLAGAMCSPVHVDQVRRLLERDTARLATDSISEAEVLELDGIVSASAAVIEDADAFSHLDYQFHRAILVATKNPILDALWVRMADLLEDDDALSRLTPLRARRRLHLEHGQIVAALSARDAAASTALINQHLRIGPDGEGRRAAGPTHL